jgi:hypothetical protein
VLRALESICNDAGFSTKHKMVLMSESNRRADIQVLNIRVAQMTDLLVDVSLRQREREREKRQERDRERETERERARNGAIAPNPPEPAAASTRVWGGKEARHLQPGSRSRQQRHCRPTPLRARNDFIGAGRDGWRTHGRLRNPDNPDQILESAAAQKIRDYRSTYRRDRQVDFLPACMSTSGRHAFFSEVDMHFSCACSSIHRGFGRIHGEFLRLLFFLANKKTDDYFEALDISRTSKISVTVAASSSSKTGAPLGWHVLRLWRYVALPPPRVATSRHLATCRPSTWPTTSTTAMSAT